MPNDATTFHHAALVFDGHTDVPTRLEERPADLHRRLADGHVDVPRLREGGVDGLVWALWVPPALAPAAGLEHARALWRRARQELRPGVLEEVGSADELEVAVARGAIGVVWGLENARPLVVPGALDEVCGWGVRIVTLCHNASHELCDSSTDLAVHGGLSPAGEAMVGALGDRGIVVDVSHAADAAVEAVLARSGAPIVASHSSAHALCPAPRNLTDDLVRAIARRGGLVMANAYPAFLDAAAARAHEARVALLGPALEALRDEIPDAALRAPIEADLLAAHPLPPVPRARLVDHILHLVDVAGPAHVGLGTDFDGIPECPVGLEDASRLPALTADLLAAGLGEAEVTAILGGNWQRVWRAVEAAARR